MSAEIIIDKLLAENNARYIKISEFRSLNKSIIWDLNDYFWENIESWEKITGNNYLNSLPSKTIYTQTDKFIESVLNTLRKLFLIAKKRNIYIMEVGGGTCMFAKKLLDTLKINETQLYNSMSYLVIETSEQMKKAALNGNLYDHSSKVKFFKNIDEYKNKLDMKLDFIFISNVWDQFRARQLQFLKSGKVSEVEYMDALNPEIYKDIGESDLSGFLKDIKLNGIQPIVQNDNQMTWYHFIKNLKLIKKTSYTTIKYTPDIFKSIFGNIFRKYSADGVEFTYNYAVLDNLDTLLSLLNGEMIVADLFITNIEEYKIDRSPKKYDSGVGIPINGLMIEEYLKSKGVEYFFENVTGIYRLLKVSKN